MGRNNRYRNGALRSKGRESYSKAWPSKATDNDNNAELDQPGRAALDRTVLAGWRAWYRQTGLLLLVSTAAVTDRHYWRNPSATTEVYGVWTGNGTASARRVRQAAECSWERSLAVGVAVCVGGTGESGMGMRSWIMD